MHRSRPFLRVLALAAVPVWACSSSIPAEPARAPSKQGAPDAFSPGVPEAFSLLGDPLFAPELPAEVRDQRERELAEADLARAGELARGRPDEVEPDGLPNERGIPTSRRPTGCATAGTTLPGRRWSPGTEPVDP